jgi:hypothetical protein
MNHLLAFEIIGEMFHQDTGLLRPGKSYPMEMPRPVDLDEQYRAWEQKNLAHVRAVYSFLEETAE